ncbi:hypothetical protein [Hymenobacter terrenus]|uniref:hypothetical protein n=1 Tax=Hymenobacter terrenus TaxID=1629124 RepID=UPI000619C656|nr:hypothetical protein [Hymenobacter terrenus]
MPTPFQTTFLFKQTFRPLRRSLGILLGTFGLLTGCTDELPEPRTAPTATGVHNEEELPEIVITHPPIDPPHDPFPWNLDPSDPQPPSDPSGPIDSPTITGTGGGEGTPSAPTTVTSGKFRINPAYAVIAPKLVQTLENLRSLVENNSKLLNGLIAFSGRTQAQIISDLTYGQGPEVKIGQPVDKFGNPVIGQFDPANPNVLTLDGAFINQLQHTTSASASDALSFYLAVSLLHEYVHFGDNLTGRDYPGEEGTIFEQTVFGVELGEGNAGQIMIQFIKKP